MEKNKFMVAIVRPIILMLNLSGLQWTFLAACLTATILSVSTVSAAKVFTKDQGLEGSVVGVTAEDVEFETVYGKGAILIQWSDIEMIRSDKEILVLYDEAEEATGRIWGLEDGALMVGQGRATAIRIPVGRIRRDPEFEPAYRPGGGGRLSLCCPRKINHFRPQRSGLRLSTLLRR